MPIFLLFYHIHQCIRMLIYLICLFNWMNKEFFVLEKSTFLRNKEEEMPGPAGTYEKQFAYPSGLPHGILHPVAGSERTVLAPQEITLAPMPFLLLLYCMEGMLLMDTRGRHYTIPGGHFFALPLHSVLHIAVNVVPCSLRYYFAGGDFRAFHSTLSQAAPVHPALHSPSPLTLDPLAHLPGEISSALLWKTHLLLTTILTTYADVLAGAPEPPSPAISAIPAYLDAMHHAIHSHSEEPHTLQHFEDRYGVNRYRLCREYRAAYGISPMRELNEIRVKNACRLLLKTPLTIQEVAARSGFYDINNFLRIFKKKTGQTPGQYRRSETI